MKTHYIVDKDGDAFFVHPHPVWGFPLFDFMGEVTHASLQELAERQGVPAYRWDSKKLAYVDLWPITGVLKSVGEKKPLRFVDDGLKVYR